MTHVLQIVRSCLLTLSHADDDTKTSEQANAQNNIEGVSKWTSRYGQAPEYRYRSHL